MKNQIPAFQPQGRSLISSVSVSPRIICSWLNRGAASASSPIWAERIYLARPEAPCASMVKVLPLGRSISTRSNTGLPRSYQPLAGLTG